jgi:hypothetical protein
VVLPSCCVVPRLLLVDFNLLFDRVCILIEQVQHMCHSRCSVAMLKRWYPNGIRWFHAVRYPVTGSDFQDVWESLARQLRVLDTAPCTHGCCAAVWIHQGTMLLQWGPSHILVGISHWETLLPMPWWGQGVL